MGGRRRAGQSGTPPAHSEPRLAAASCSCPQARRRAGGGAVFCHAPPSWPLEGCLKSPASIPDPLPSPVWGEPFSYLTPQEAQVLRSLSRSSIRIHAPGSALKRVADVSFKLMTHTHPTPGQPGAGSCRCAPFRLLRRTCLGNLRSRN